MANISATEMCKVLESLLTFQAKISEDSTSVNRLDVPAVYAQFPLHLTKISSTEMQVENDKHNYYSATTA